MCLDNKLIQYMKDIVGETFNIIRQEKVTSYINIEKR